LMPCPWCGGKLIIDEKMPFHFCFGRNGCEADRLCFDELIQALGRTRP
jgi:hypothetical protein